MSWERFADDVFHDAKQSTPHEKFTEQVRASFIAWATGNGAAELAAAKDPYAVLRRKLSETAGIPLRDSSRRKPQKKESLMSSSPNSVSPFDNLGQSAHVPSEMQPRISVRDINTAEPGPYYVFIPGIDADGLKEMLHSIHYARIPAGEIFQIGAIEESMLAGRLDMAVPHKEVIISHAIEQRVVDKLHVIAIPASTTLKALQADRAVTQHILAHIAAFDKLDVEYKMLNDMIRPLVRQPDGSMGAIQELTKPAEFRKELEAVGMLAMRLRWLQEAAEKLETGRMLEVHRRVIDEKPFLRGLWLKVIQDVLIPSIDQFRTVAETRIAAIEDRMRNPQNSDNYDRYSFRLMWLLGRQPERTALSRTLNDAGRGGLSAEEQKMFIANEVARMTGGSAQAQSVRETMQCPDCGEDVRTIAGGPPRKCRHCGYEFRAPDPDGNMNRMREAVELPESVILPEESTGTQAAAELDTAAPLAVAEPEAQVQVIEAASTGAGLSPEDEAEIEDIAASVLRGTAKG